MPDVVNMPDAESIREAAREVINRPEFDLNPDAGWRASLMARLYDWLYWLFKPVIDLFRALHDLSPPVAWTVTALLVLLLIAICWHMVYTFRQALKRRAHGQLAATHAVAEPDPGELETQARTAAGAGDYINAVRLLFIACLQRLHKSERRTLRKGVTNREILRRYAQTPAFEALRTFVDTIDAKWYGRGICERDDFERCAAAHARIRDAQEGSRARHA